MKQTITAFRPDKYSPFFLFIVALSVCFASCSQNGSDTKKQTEPVDQFAGFLKNTTTLPSTKIKTAELRHDTIFISLDDSIDWNQGIDEGMITYYLLNEAHLACDTAKWISMHKDYPNRTENKEYSFTVKTSELAELYVQFRDPLFYELSAYLVHLKNARTGESILGTLNAKWAMLKNGNLTQSWGENFFEILYPFCAECSSGNKGQAWQAMIALRAMKFGENNTRGVMEANKVLDYFISRCSSPAK